MAIGGCDDYGRIVNSSIAVDLSGKVFYYEFIVRKHKLIIHTK